MPRLFFTILLSIEFSTVFCQNDIRLAGIGSTANTGRVEVLHNGLWGTICDDNIDVNAVAVICRMLNFNNGGNVVNNTVFGPGSGPIWMDGILCLGHESKLENCMQSGTVWNNSDCNHTEDAAVHCRNSVYSHGNVRLIEPQPNSSFGYVEAQINGTWGAVCNTNWNVNNAKVICRQLHFNASYASAGAPVSVEDVWDNVTKSFALDDLGCLGTEVSILNCSYKTAHACNTSNMYRYARVSCVSFPSIPTQVLVPSLTCSNGKFEARFSKQNHPNIREEHFKLAKNHTCNLNKNTTVNAIIISLYFHDCGTIPLTNSTHIIFQNELLYQGTEITAPAYSIRLRCEFKRDYNSSVVDIQPITDQVTQEAPGQYNTRLNFYTDATFSTPILSYPLQIVVGEYVYVAAILITPGTNLKIVVQSCHATPDTNPNNPVNYQLISNKCPSDPALHISFLPVNNTMFGFAYKSFKFKDYDSLYIHCDVTVCLSDEMSNQCDRNCHSRRRRSDASPYRVYHVRSRPMHFMSEIIRGEGKTNVSWVINQNLYLLIFVVIRNIVFM